MKDSVYLEYVLNKYDDFWTFYGELQKLYQKKVEQNFPWETMYWMADGSAVCYNSHTGNIEFYD